MKIVFNSREREAACTVFYQDAFAYCKDIALYDYERYEEYDVALFMTYQRDLEEMRRVKKTHPALRTAIIDPRGGQVAPYLPYADFLIVDSLEMKDFWAYCNKPIFQYVEYPDIGVLTKEHQEKEKIIIGYHGNKVHLECMCDRITPALEQIAEKYHVELWAMYNIDALCEWISGRPGNIRVKDIQWSMKNYHEVLGKVDIGINPCFMPTEA
ncbi:MAG: hypothetical protein D3910_07925, partial [Candidatus Electrothrix sp. ATG2]|nr:hypothetical protein [Candidatus Electrothrix sp. ATG2]